MHPVICKLGPFTIYSYGLMVAIAFSIATFLPASQARKHGFCPELVFNLSFLILISGIIGARLLYVVLNSSYYFNNPGEIFALTHGGFAWFGGLIFASLCSIIYLKYKRLEVARIFDLAAPYVALGHAIGRIGCFLNGCCYGKEVARFGIYFPVHDAVLIPTQLYSSLALLTIFLILRVRQTQAYQKGEIFLLYLLLYSAWRFFIEFFRGDTQIFFFGLTIFQIFSIALFIFSIIMLIRVRRQAIK